MSDVETIEEQGFYGRIVRYAPLLFWVGVIFFLSSQAGAMSETSRFIGPLIQFFFPEMPYESRQVIHGFVRKSAHFIEYAVLAALAVRAFRVSSIDRLRENRFLLAVAFAAIVASLDEFHQSFNSARTGTVFDVFLDIAGATSATLLIWFVGRWRRRKKTKRDSPGEDNTGILHENSVTRSFSDSGEY